MGHRRELRCGTQSVAGYYALVHFYQSARFDAIMPVKAFPYTHTNETVEECDISHERYTTEYIAREAFLLIRFIINKNKFRNFNTEEYWARSLSKRDKRILKRWNLI